MENIIQLNQVTKKFGGITALNKASLHVKKGEVVGLIGDNGAGKSTLIKTLVGVYSPDEGEILIRGENVMLGYWNQKEATEEVLKNGWLHTGDIGVIDNNGNLKITDRKKDIIVNLGGDNISPSKIENILCLNELIKQSFVYRDKKNYLVALIVTDKEIYKEKIQKILENINKNLTLIEKIKKFVLIHEEFTINNGMLTPTLKLKRKEIIKNYKQQLENLY